jgi:Fic family protein
MQEYPPYFYMNPHLDFEAYDGSAYADDPKDLFLAVNDMRNHVSSILESPDSTNAHHKLDEYSLDILGRLIYGSNLIENAGSSLKVTRMLCEHVFYGDIASLDDDISPLNPLYPHLKSALLQQNRTANDKAVQTSYHQIVQHCRALNFLIDEIEVNKKTLSENVILEAHRILTYKLDSADAKSFTMHAAGRYRTKSLDTLATCTPPQYIAQEMRLLISDLGSDIDLAIKTGRIDPYMLAAEYSLRFANIHPFASGNGQMCRLILNLLLFAYSGAEHTGLYCVFGSSETEIKQYRALMARASQAQQTLVERDEHDSAKAPWSELAFVLLAKAKEEGETSLAAMEDSSTP